jgi:superfamily II DNA or RNA helicase
MNLWPWQRFGINRAIEFLKNGVKRICIQAPTGMGKGKVLEGLSLYSLEKGSRTGLLTNRRLLTKQTGDRFTAAGINYGYISAEHGFNPFHSMLIMSTQTVRARIANGRLALPNFGMILIDEAHNRDFDAVTEKIRQLNPDVAVIGLTATPVRMSEKYDELIIAGTKAEGREHGALVPCTVFSAPEPDMDGVRMNSLGEYVYDGMVKRVMQCTVFADIFDAWMRHGGVERPTVLWAPGVPESRWLVDEFIRRGINAAHIDGKTPEAERNRIREGSESGDIRVVSSFGVLREGIDWPWLSYGIMVQVCGAYSTFIQMVGRILRAYEGKHDAILQDHSGTWWRHGSPNDDYEWTLDFSDRALQKERQKALQEGKINEDISCPQCGGIRRRGPTCPHCGHTHSDSVRPVRMVDGRLVQMVGQAVKRKNRMSDDQRHWTAALFKCGATGRNFNQAFWVAQRTLGRSPVNVRPWPECNWDLPVAQVYPNFCRRKQW